MASAERLRAAPIHALREDLAALYRSWEMLDLLGETVAAMPPQWLAILNIARNLLEGDPPPGVDVPDDLLNLIGPAEREIVTVERTEHRRRMVISPSDDTTLQPLRHIYDYDRITLPDLMLRDLDRELFEFRLLSGSINGQYPVDARPTTEEWDELVEERIRTRRPVRKRRQKVYVLLDVSNSMREENRAIFAKALVLAYLVSAAAEGSRLYFRTFANTVHERSDCTSREGFPALARRVLGVAPDGGTDIKRALDVAITDIRRLDELNTFERLFEVPPTEILLVSDCESYSVPYIPAGIKLHTVHLGGRRMMSAYEQGFARIMAESTTFHEIHTAALELPDTARERWLLLQDRRTKADGGWDATDFELDRERREQRRDALLTIYERMEEGRSGRKAVRRTIDAFHVRPQFPFASWWRSLRRWFGHWPMGGGEWRARRRAVRQARAPLGMEFRVRQR